MSILSKTRNLRDTGVELRFLDAPPERLSRVFARLFETFSSGAPEWIAGVPASLDAYVELAAAGKLMATARAPEPEPYRPAPRPDDETVIVGFTGGKDSVAAALALEAAGLRPLCFHVAGLNRSYPQEEALSREIAAARGWELVVRRVRQSGRSAFPDNPVKNQLILALAADYGAPRGIRHYSQGAHQKDNVGTLARDFNGSDFVEMYDTALPFFQAAVPGFTLHVPLQTDAAAYQTLVRLGPELIPLLSSCILPLRYRPATRRANERKFGQLLPRRCGSCHKCVKEDIALGALGIVPVGPARLRHDLDRLRQAWSQVLAGAPPADDAEMLEAFLEAAELDWRPLLAQLHKVR
jgi:7-cyano-7-deazaguanine synthase in queuosine biosynthesis